MIPIREQPSNYGAVQVSGIDPTRTRPNVFRNHNTTPPIFGFISTGTASTPAVTPNPSTPDPKENCECCDSVAKVCKQITTYMCYAFGLCICQFNQKIKDGVLIPNPVGGNEPLRFTQQVDMVPDPLYFAAGHSNYEPIWVLR